MRRLALATAVALTLLAGACSGADAEVVTPPGPDDIPLPPGSVLLGSGDVATFAVPDARVEDVVSFLATTLPETGWTVAQRWEGQDGHGVPSAGLIIERDDETGAVSVIEQDDHAIVRLNLRQPEYRPGGMNAPRPPAVP